MSLISSPAAPFLEWVVLEHTGKENLAKVWEIRKEQNSLIVLQVSGKIDVEETRRETQF